MPDIFDTLVEDRQPDIFDQVSADSGESAAFQAADEQQAMERGELKPSPPANPIPFLEKPLVEFPHLPVTKEQSFTTRLGSAALNKIGDFVSGTTSFQGLIGLVPPVGAAQIVAQAPDLIEKVREADLTPPGSPDRIDAGLDVVAAIGSLGALGAGTKAGLRPKESVRPFIGAEPKIAVPKETSAAPVKEAVSESVDVQGQNALRDIPAYRYGDEKGDMTFFSKNRDYSEEYATERGGTAADVKEAKVTLENPLIIDAPDNKFSSPEYERPIIEQAKAAGHDGVVFRNGPDEFYVKFRGESEQAPSVPKPKQDVFDEVSGEKETDVNASNATRQNAPFEPSTEWQEVPPGTVLPNGGEYRMDQATGKSYARWSPENVEEARRSQSLEPKSTSQYAASDQQSPTSLNPLGTDQAGRPSQQTPQVEPTPTSTKNAITNAERESRGIQPAEQTAKREFGTVWDEAEAIAKADTDAPRRLVESINENPRALTDKENALLLRRQIEVQNEHDAAVRAVNEAVDDASRMDATARLERVRDDLQAVYDAGKAAGTETGRGLNARKMMANDDFSLAKMEATTRAIVNDGKPLSPKQAADVAALHERIRVAERRLAEYETRERFNDLIKEAQKEARARKASGKTHRSFLEERAAKARERIKEMPGVCSL